VGTLLLHPVSNAFVQIKQVAIEPQTQGKSLGKNLMIYAEEIAERLGFSTIFLTGRKQAWGFYEKLAYQELPYEYQEDQLILKIFKKEIRQPLTRITTKEMKTNGRQ
jgi:N-acetylglutamate synthase-like GNAT family acetyltransferase